MLEHIQEKIEEVLNKFMEKSIDSVLEGKVNKVDLVGVSLVNLLKYFNSKVPKVHQLNSEDIRGEKIEINFNYELGLYQKYSIVGNFFHGWIEFSLNSSYDN